MRMQAISGAASEAMVECIPIQFDNLSIEMESSQLSCIIHTKRQPWILLMQGIIVREWAGNRRNPANASVSFSVDPTECARRQLDRSVQQK